MSAPDLPVHVRAAVDQVEGWLSEREAAFLYDAARRAAWRGGLVVEIGSFCGKSTVCMGLAVKDLAGRVVAIDPHTSDLEHQGRGSSFPVFERNIAQAGLADVVTPIVARSQDVTWQKPIGFLWIDGDHSYAGAMSDFERYAPHLIEGGIIGFHDATQDEVPRVAVQAFKQACYVQLGVVDSIAYARKASGGRKSWRDRLILLLLGHYSDIRRLRVFKRFKEPLKRTLARI